MKIIIPQSYLYIINQILKNKSINLKNQISIYLIIKLIHFKLQNTHQIEIYQMKIE